MTPSHKPISAIAWRSLSCMCLAAALGGVAFAQSVSPSLYAGLKWRSIGPMRGGRIAAVSGVIGVPGTYYAGLPMGGVWKTTDAGMTWNPIMDSVKEVSSIGSVAVAPSDANVIYAGTGDMVIRDLSRGNGMYKSTDAGKTWQHIGLEGTDHIVSLLVDPKNPDIVLAAALGPVYKASPDRGIFRTEDGGKTWTKVLYPGDDTGAERLAWDPDNPSIVYATTVEGYRKRGGGPGGGGGFGGRGGQRGENRPASKTMLYRSTDEGKTWQKVEGKGLPELDGRTCVAVAMHTNDQRLFVVQNSGLWRSDDAGASWKPMDPTDRRVRNGQGGYNCGVYVNTQNPDIVYVINTCCYISTDGGETFTGMKGAPGGDDPQQMWIDPTDGNRIFLGMDQGATISQNGGKSWSSWYNQPTGQIYHISVDNRTPFWVYGSEQDSGCVETSSRGIYGEITPLDWSPNPGYEFGTIVPDPIDPRITYAMGSGSAIEEAVFPSGQWHNIGPDADRDLGLHMGFDRPLIFSRTNPHELIAGFQMLMATTDRGAHWHALSPDLTHPKGWKPPQPDGNSPFGGFGGSDNDLIALAKAESEHEDGDGDDDGQNIEPELQPDIQMGYFFGSISCLSPSSVDGGTIWVGTSNGLIWVTKDHGKTWDDVSIPKLPNKERSNISSIDASHLDKGTAYCSVEAHSSGDFLPYIYRTHDYGKTWQLITTGLPTDDAGGSYADVVRCDTKKAGLLFAGTESSLYVSFNDGNSWQSIAQTLPNTAYRDLVVHDNDLVAGTYGRGVWVLDDIGALRQMDGVTGSAVHLFKPDTALRIRRNVGQDTPFPPEVPHRDNPPQGAVLDYVLPDGTSGPLTITIKDSSGKVMKVLSSVPEPPLENAVPPEPNFWLAAPKPLGDTPGEHRAVWNMRLTDPNASSHSYEINANPGATPPSPQGPLVPPGTYTAVLVADGVTQSQTFQLVNDPLSPGSAGSINILWSLEMQLYTASGSAWKDQEAVASLRKQLADLTAGKPSKEIADAADALDKKLEAMGGGGRRGFFFGGPRPGRGGPAPTPSFSQLVSTLNGMVSNLDSSDMAPNGNMVKSCRGSLDDFAKAEAKFAELKSKDIPALNRLLTQAGLPTLN